MIDLPLGAHLPDSYIGDSDLKVRLYRAGGPGHGGGGGRGAGVPRPLRALPPPVADMFYILRVKALAKARFLRGIETQGDTLVICTSPFVVTDRLALYKGLRDGAVVRNQQVRCPARRSRSGGRRTS